MSQTSGTLKSTSSRGDVHLKIDNWPQAVVIVSGILATGGVVVCLVNAGWSGEAIAAFATLAVGLFAGQLATARKASSVDAKTDQQTKQLAVIQEQTNGHSDDERHALAVEAAEHAIRKVTGR